MLPLLDGVELVCVPPDFSDCDEEPGFEVDESFDDVEPVDDGLSADSDDELEADDDELEGPDDELEGPDDELEGPDDELEAQESVVSANATPGVFATAAPTPNANANAPARAMYCALNRHGIYRTIGAVFHRSRHDRRVGILPL